VRLITKRQAEPEPETEAKPEEEAPKAKGEPEEPKAEPPSPAQLNLAAPYNVAKTFVKRSVAKDGKPRYAFVGRVQGELVRMPTLLYWQKEFYRWNGQCYEVAEDDDVKAHLYEFLDQSVELDGRTVLPRSRSVNEILDALQMGTKFNTGEVPAWIGVSDRPEPRGLLACRNGLLEFDTGKLWDHDPRFFGLNKVDFDFDPQARCPRWEQFLGELWPGDGEAIGTLQEFFGLWVTEVTKFQKACVLIGPPRCGKGTIGRVAKGFLGSTSFAAVSLQTLGTDQFGMEHLIGKKLALVPDVKLDGRANVTLVMERLLTTIGEDEQAINRKNKKYWLGRLGIRWVILGNDVPKFRGSDEAGALVKRCVMLEMKEDFFGREDFDLTEKLLAERAGILNWAMEGWHRLRDRDRFVQPASGVGLLGKLQASTSTMGAFIDDCCVLEPEEKVSCDGLWLAFREWSDRRRLSVTLSKNTFSGALHRVFPSIVTSRPGVASAEERRPRWFFGVKLRPGWRE
jgi:putative DNA primase/helicase